MITDAINKLAVAQDETLRYEIVGFCENEADFNAIQIEDSKSFNFTWADVQAKATELEAEEQAKIDTKASAKAKLVAGEALTEEEANTIVL
jgi:hypothetical protein|tara:strand:- start:226 stop:498 length:273 start_codon:yes stop_codon:yes gene_type:complete